MSIARHRGRLFLVFAPLAVLSGGSAVARARGGVSREPRHPLWGRRKSRRPSPVSWQCSRSIARSASVRPTQRGLQSARGARRRPSPSRQWTRSSPSTRSSGSSCSTRPPSRRSGGARAMVGKALDLLVPERFRAAASRTHRAVRADRRDLAANGRARDTHGAARHRGGIPDRSVDLPASRRGELADGHPARRQRSGSRDGGAAPVEGRAPGSWVPPHKKRASWKRAGSRANCTTSSGSRSPCCAWTSPGARPISKATARASQPSSSGWRPC